MIELVASVGLLASCLALYRFFRGGIMSQSFLLFTGASVLFLIGRLVATLVAFGTLAQDPYDEIHLTLEIGFVALLLAGFTVLHRKWMTQHRLPENNTPITTV